MDPEYVRRYQAAFGAAPEKPYLEFFIPERFRTAELLYAIYGPIWRLEHDVIWPDMARLLRRRASGVTLSSSAYSAEVAFCALSRSSVPCP
jgi:hypothetical protein